MLLSSLFGCLGVIAVLAMLITLIRYGPLVGELRSSLLDAPVPEKDRSGLRVQFLTPELPDCLPFQPYRPKFMTSRLARDAAAPAAA